jgi:hypothetical protein
MNTVMAQQNLSAHVVQQFWGILKDDPMFHP